MAAGDWSFPLPERLIAQEPAPRRSQSRLLVLHRSTGAIEHLHFRDILRLLGPGDLIVANDSAVMPARLLGRRRSGGRVECLLLERSTANGGEGTTTGARSQVAPPARPETTGRRVERWSCLARPARRLRPRERIEFAGGLSGSLVERRGEVWRIDLESRQMPSRVIERVGKTPLPPYIHRAGTDRRDPMDRRRYRTVYQDEAGSAAAPTAGLHFSRDILKKLQVAGVGWAPLTLHLSAASFLPVRPHDPERAELPAEHYRLPAATVRSVAAARRNGGRVVAVGTSTTRVLESCRGRQGRLVAGRGTCTLFIRPGFEFGVIDGMLTNFHLPESTHLLLVAAFAGRDRILAAYRQAIRSEYRFYSYGDAMLIL
jgi:S-adenosylmethionine:tRNA ribosyltransferase-isomerase